MIFDPPGNKMLATRLDCLIGSELSEPSRAELTLTERISCSVRGFPSQAELRACSVRLGSLPSLWEIRSRVKLNDTTVKHRLINAVVSEKHHPIIPLVTDQRHDFRTLTGLIDNNQASQKICKSARMSSPFWTLSMRLGPSLFTGFCGSRC